MNTKTLSKTPEDSTGNPPTNSEDEAASSSSLYDKLQVLLTLENVGGDSSIPVVFEQERCLVAWVLLTRLSQDHLDRAWAEYHVTLESFAIELLKKENPHRCELYLRLIAQVISRTTGNTYPKELGRTLLESWTKISLETATKTCSIQLHMDVCSAFDLWMESDPVAADELGILEWIWKVYCSTASAFISSSDDRSNKKIDCSKGSDDTIEEKEWEIMWQTLEALLNRTEEQDEYSNNSWQEMILAIFQSHGCELTPDELVPSILDFITTQAAFRQMPNEEVFLPSALCATWDEWVLSLIQTRAACNHAFRFILLQNPKTVSAINQLLLAHVVSPSDQSLRAMAWQTLIGMVETCGWNWMLQASSFSSSTKLGFGTTVCTWVRMASGEYRIQLQTPSDSAWLQATALPVGHACARLLISVVEYLVKLEEEPYRMPLSSEALLHLRQSLEQALWTTVEYLQEYICEEGSNRSFSTIAIQLFGTLLMEIDVWELTGKEYLTNSPQIILKCLRMILPTIAEDYSLLPGLVNILGDAESDSEKLKQLNGLWEPLVEYLESFWHRETDHMSERIDDTVAWACSCTELWATLDENADSNNSKRRLAMALIEWIQGVLHAGPNDLHQITLPRLQSYLSLAIGCYMTLSKDRDKPPLEHESRVIVRALQLCEML